MPFEDRKEFWSEFIQLLQQKRCLWDVNTKGYHNKHIKNAAYEVLVAKCKEIYPRANKDFVMKKIASLRASFRRQRRKISEARKSATGDGETYMPVPTLWYYDHLLFLVGQKEQREDVTTLEEDSNPRPDIANIQELRQLKRERYSTETNSENRLSRASSYYIRDIDIDSVHSNNETEELFVRKRPRRTSDPLVPQKQENVFNVPLIETIPDENVKKSDECDLYGQLLAMKLKSLNVDDRLKLMNDIDNLVFKHIMDARKQGS